MNFNKKLEIILTKNKKFCDMGGGLLKQKVKSLALSFDEDLIEILLNDKDTKKHFFKNISGATIFDYRRFIDFIDDKNFLLDSYTKFSNKVGLTISDKHIKQIDNVVLTFPFKDCILEGGQSKEDESRKEIFFNETLAKDEISRLLDKKVIANATKYYYENGTVQETNDFTFTRDKEINKARGLSEDTITDNLIIKGNNLLALHSLKSNFAGKVKLIYIDPPYNTGNDGFKYNDSFNHSTWLTFMKNRLEIARDLLTDDGLIFIHLDYNESHYLKVLMDEIFGNDKFINEIIWRRKQATSYGKNKFGIVADNIFLYSKTETFVINPIYSKDDDNTKKYIKERFVYDDGDGRKYMKSPLVNSLYRPNLKYVFQGINPPPNGWLYSEKRMQEMFENGELIIPKKKDARIYRKIFLDTYKGQAIQSLWTDISIVNPMAKEQTDFETGQKPEKLLERIIYSATNKSDIILDFHLGSGTTSAVAHKMDRQYIGIEQMDYIQEITIPRLKSIIDGDQSGISENVNWKGGGEFIYFELDKYNQKFIDKLSVATEDNILDIYKEITEKGFLNYDVELHKIEEHFEEFKAFSLEDKQEFLISILNKNMLYKNLSEIDDSEYEVDSKTKAINADFYNLSKSGK